MNVVIFVGSEDFVLFSFVQFCSVLLDIEDDDLRSHVGRWLCDFWVMGVVVDVLDVVVHAIG